jgi:UDP-GlcNAc:undecaprenyl-phosphate/decaprenyl-phosphate GlcNAc-1-phosphate transferase
MAPLAPLACFVVPMYDLIGVTWIRLARGVPPWIGDNNHISHRLVALGLSRRSAVLMIYALTLVSIATAVLCWLGSARVAGMAAVALSTVVALLAAADLRTHRRPQPTA